MGPWLGSTWEQGEDGFRGNRPEGMRVADAGPPYSPVSRSDPKGDRLQPVDPWGPTEGSSHLTSHLTSQHPTDACEQIFQIIISIISDH